MKKKKSNFRNQVVSDARRQKRQASSYGYLTLPKGVTMFNMKEKTSEVNLDFIPYKVTVSNHPDRNDDEGRAVLDSLWYKHPFKIHKDVGVEREKLICSTSVGKKCPICEWVNQKRKDGEDWDNLKEIVAKKRNLYAVIPINSEEHEEIIHVWDMSYHLFQEELNEQLEEKEENGVFPDLEEGKTLLVKFRWKKYKGKTYPTTRDISFEDRAEQYNESILEKVPNLDELLVVLSYKELETKFFETEDEPEAEEVVEYTEDEDTPKSVKMHRKTKVIKEREVKPEEREDESKEGKPKPDRKESENALRTNIEEATVENECPHGLKFGEDCEKEDFCDECDKWDACDDERKALEK